MRLFLKSVIETTLTSWMSMQHSSYTQLQLKLMFWKDALASLPHLDIIQHSMGLEYNRNILLYQKYYLVIYMSVYTLLYFMII